MDTRPRFEAVIRKLGIAVMLLCGVGAVAGMVVVLIRVPALAATKLDVLFGTLQGAAVSLLFGIVALLINLTLMIRRASLQLRAAPWSERARS
jgi:membrane-associated phospholipid phosphatase